jgi:hypothetical protein
LFRKHTAWVNEYFNEPPPSRPELTERITKLKVQRDQARNAGDKAKAGALQEQIRALRQSNPLTRATNEFHQAIIGELTAEQGRKFQKIIDRLRRKGTGLGGAGLRITRLRQAAYRVGLRPDQRTALRELFGRYMRKIGDSGGDSEALQKVEAELNAAIRKELDEEQKATFQRTLKELEAQAGKPDGGGGPSSAQQQRRRYGP